MTTIEILRGARELVARPGGWTQKALGRDENGDELVAGYSGSGLLRSVCVCAEGAVCFVDFLHRHAAMRALRLAIDPSDLTDVHRWNDAKHRTQAEVVAAFDRAIASLEAKS